MCANFSCHSSLGCFSWCFHCHSPLCNQDCYRAFCCCITPAQTVITDIQTKIIFSARDHYLNCHFSPVLLNTIPSPLPKALSSYVVSLRQPVCFKTSVKAANSLNKLEPLLNTVGLVLCHLANCI